MGCARLWGCPGSWGRGVVLLGVGAGHMPTEKAAPTGEGECCDGRIAPTLGQCLSEETCLRLGVLWVGEAPRLGVMSQFMSALARGHFFCGRVGSD